MQDVRAHGLEVFDGLCPRYAIMNMSMPELVRGMAMFEVQVLGEELHCHVMSAFVQGGFLFYREVPPSSVPSCITHRVVRCGLPNTTRIGEKLIELLNPAMWQCRG
jgi:hypothetical protein